MNKLRFRIILAVGCCFASLAFAVSPCPMELATETLKISGKQLTTEIAADNASRRCGLSQRRRLAENNAMLFVYPYPLKLSFWMKDTHIALSIAFLDDDGRIISIQRMAPLRTDVSYSSPSPARYALEVNQGWFKVHGINVGDIVEIPKNLR
ncbi:DUF192 domain-containing protein [Kaarinaea lacus]